MPAALLCICLPALVAGLGMVTITLTRRGQGAVAWRAMRDAIKGLPGALRKRRKLQAARRVSSWSIWRILDRSLPGARR
jgi:hypothetical protein